MSKKPVIVFEGIEGSGKSHHINVICKYLTKKKIKFIKIREPGGNPNSEIIRKLILNKKTSFNKNTDLLLYLASRSENIGQLKKYYKKRIILIDRFIDSTYAYQHFGFGINLNLIKSINNFLLKNFKVRFTFLNIVNLKNMQKRLKKRKSLNRYDNFKKNFYKKVQSGFLKISKKNKAKYLIINSNLDIKNNETLIINKFKDLIK
ncbi:dTMP kinase [Pelagibacterales bacterium SAG-MED13]|nr:dTMP kinase [Pelagibacterales bacterium SAG-MED13]|tara:strand:- start:138 stop:752 length:615 start_codon:yes stop_codon:yes gene_type:complete